MVKLLLDSGASVLAKTARGEVCPNVLRSKFSFPMVPRSFTESALSTVRWITKYHYLIPDETLIYCYPIFNYRDSYSHSAYLSKLDRFLSSLLGSFGINRYSFLVCLHRNTAILTKKWQAPLSVAVARGDTSTVTLLLQKTGDIELNVTNIKGETPLYSAVSRGETSIAQLLLQKGANPHLFPLNGETLLNLAISKGSSGLTQLLLNRGVDLETKNQAGETPL
jgi:hypothetical protein